MNESINGGMLWKVGNYFNVCLGEAQLVTFSDKLAQATKHLISDLNKCLEFWVCLFIINFYSLPHYTQGENKHLETLGFNSFPLALLAATLTTKPWIFGAFYHLNPVPIAYHIFLSKCDERERKGSGYGDCWYTSTFSFLHHLDFFVYFNQQQLSLAARRSFLTSSSLHLQPTTALEQYFN